MSSGLSDPTLISHLVTVYWHLRGFTFYCILLILIIYANNVLWQINEPPVFMSLKNAEHILSGSECEKEAELGVAEKTTSL